MRLKILAKTIKYIFFFEKKEYNIFDDIGERLRITPNKYIHQHEGMPDSQRPKVLMTKTAVFIIDT